MTTFTVWKFDDPDGAAHAATILKGTQDERLIKIVDYAVLSWPADASQPKMKHGHSGRHRSMGWGAFWGLIVGGLFLVPVLGAAAGVGVGAIANATEGVGIGKDDLEKIRTEITPGTSALMVITEEGDLDRVGERFHGMHWHLVGSNLTGPEQRLLMETFGDD